MRKRSIPPLMSHEERMALIQQPFPVITMPGRSWGGSMAINDTEVHHHNVNRRLLDAEYRSWFQHLHRSGA